MSEPKAPRKRAGYTAAAGVAAAGAVRIAYFAMNRRPPGGPKVWARTNHRGEPELRRFRA